MKLADYRDKAGRSGLLVKQDTSHRDQSVSHISPRSRSGFKDQPLAILAIHDASLTSLAKFNKALAPLRNQVAGEIPINFASRPGACIGESRRPPLLAGEDGSGRTADTYGGAGFAFVIDKNGEMVMAVMYTFLGLTTFTIGRNGKLVCERGDARLKEDGTEDLGFAWGLSRIDPGSSVRLAEIVQAEVERRG